MVVGSFFVTPHAVQQFQRRIAPLSYEHALAAILHGMAQEPERKKTASGHVYVRVRRPYAFRAIIGDGQITAEKPLPAVVTILKG